MNKHSTRTVLTQKIRLSWTLGILAFRQYLITGDFVTYTFPPSRKRNSSDSESRIHPEKDRRPTRSVRFSYASSLGREMIRRINITAFGRRYREKKLGLLMFFTLEDLKSNPHIHVLIEPHEKLTESVLKQIWRSLVGYRWSEKAFDAKRIDTRKKLFGYVTKKIDWDKVETLPWPNIPPRLVDRWEKLTRSLNIRTTQEELGKYIGGEDD